MMKVILPVRDIPDHATVTKLAGTKKYVLKGDIRVYDLQGDPRVISAYGDSKFLVDAQGASDPCAVSGDKEMVWHAAECRLRAFLEEREMGASQ